MSLKESVKSVINHFGFDLRRYRPEFLNDAQFVAMLKKHNVNLVFDVGANIGQFAKQLRDVGYGGRMVSFEPLSSAYEQLIIASESDDHWQIAPQAAIGSEDGEIEIHLAGNSVSSSVLNMLDTHANAAPGSAYVSSEKVALKRLDTIATGYVEANSVLFIKIDTQGYEDHVLQGAPNLLAKAIGVQLELSLVPLYDGQCLYDEMIAQLKALGFELWSVNPMFFDPETKRLLQVDATFFR